MLWLVDYGSVRSFLEPNKIDRFLRLGERMEILVDLSETENSKQRISADRCFKANALIQRTQGR